jgi:hypothetical protein
MAFENCFARHTWHTSPPALADRSYPQVLIAPASRSDHCVHAPMIENLPQTSVLYVKNGEYGRWWPVSKAKGQLHAGWSNIPHEILLNPDYATIKTLEIEDYIKRGKPKGSAIADANALWRLLHVPSQHVWITFEEGWHVVVHSP